MKKVIVSVMILAIAFASAAQSEETQQLALNIEKLAQMKKVLANMKKGYEVISKGYNTVWDISKGNFDLHKAFLDRLFNISLVVSRYKKIGDIVSYQHRLVKEYKTAFLRFKDADVFNGNEVKYIENVYAHLLDESVKNLDELVMIITAGKLRMNDEERIKAIDRIFADMEDKLVFLRNFNRDTNVLALQRYKEKREAETSQKLYGLK